MGASQAYHLRNLGVILALETALPADIWVAQGGR
jgi:hypothetical protein